MLKNLRNCWVWGYQNICYRIVDQLWPVLEIDDLMNIWRNYGYKSAQF